MNRVSRPLQIGLVAGIAFFAIWTVALKPSSSSSGTATPAPAPALSTHTSSNGILSAPAKARKAVGTADAAGAASAGATPATPGSTTTPITPVVPSSTVSASPPAQSSLPTATTASPAPQTTPQTKPQTAPAAGHAAVTQSADQRLGVVGRAIKAHKVVAMLFYNSAAPDDREVRHELATIPYKRGNVISLAVPIVELSNYPVVTTQVPVLGSPTLVIVDPRQQASTIVGFADTFEISQRIADAMSVH